MSITIEIEINENITIYDLLELKDISYGHMSESYVLDYNVVGKHTTVFDKKHLCRGIDVSIDQNIIQFLLLLPSSKEEIEYMYELVELVCLKYNIKEFIKNNEYLSLKHLNRCINEDIQVSENTLFNIKEELDNRVYVCYCVHNPVSLSLKELDEIDSLESFSSKIHQLQALDAYYEVPHFYKSNQDKIIGVYFTSIDELVVLPINPRPIYMKEEHIDEWFIQIDGLYRLKYHDFIACIDTSNKYDATHCIIEINHQDMYELVKYNYDLVSDEYSEAIYWNKLLDDGRSHSMKVDTMSLSTDPMNGYNHMAVYLRWMIEHDLISDKLLDNFSDIKEYVKDEHVDIRELIKENECFSSQLRYDHFNEEGQAFSDYCYVFNAYGFPKTVDLYAETVLGSELYHCDEYKDDAYLFVNYDETYYQGLSSYIDKLYKEFKEKK